LAFTTVANTYYTPAYGSTNFLTVTATEDVTYYHPFFVPSSTTFDRIGAVSASTFVGTAVVRLGIFNNSNGEPTTVVLDAGTVSFTGASQGQEITISQALDQGWYWLAFNMQTAGTTNTFTGNNPFPLGLMRQASLGNLRALSWSESGVTGAFATAGSLTRQTAATPSVWMRTA
jgi:hypothetical protein